MSTTGGHQLVVTKPGYQTYSTEVFVADDQVREVNVPLNREVKTSWVAWGVGTLLVVTGGIVAGYFVFKPTEPSPTLGHAVAAASRRPATGCTSRRMMTMRKLGADALALAALAAVSLGDGGRSGVLDDEADRARARRS